jgi:hypothetical protein
MNTSRIEVPLTVSPPHFDDERTIATARQVKPIGRAKVTEGWRKARTLLPLLFLATLCGGLGAASVNYYERRQSAQVVTPQAQANNGVPAQPKIEPTPLAIAASAVVNGSQTPSETKPLEVEQPIAKSDEQAPQPEAQPTQDKNLSVTAPSPEKKRTDADAAKLTRKRRVLPPDDKTQPAQRNGAARISDIFNGPNP